MSAAPQLDPTPTLTAQRGGLATTQPAKMDFYKLQNHFWQLHAEEHFTGTQIGLYFYWLNLFNAGLRGEYWPDQYPRFCKQVEADLDISDKTLATARQVLEQRGLLYYQEGTRTKAATWSLKPISRKNSGSQTPVSRKNSDRQPDDVRSDDRNNSERQAPDVRSDSRKNSGLYKEKTEDSSVVENTNKKNAGAGEDFSSLAESKKSVTAPTPQPPAPPADDAAEARAFVPELAALWKVNEARNFQSWAKLTRFVLAVAARGELAYLREQFAGYRAFFSNGLTPHNLDKFTGHEGQAPPYSLGTWCECDWPAKAADRKPSHTPSGPAEAPARASASPSNRKNSWR